MHETTHQPLLSTLSAIVETVVALREHGHKVVLVSSGAIGVGLKRMDVASRPKSLSKKQVRGWSSLSSWRAFGRAPIVRPLSGVGGDRAGTPHRAMGQLVRTARAAYRAGSAYAR